MESDDDGAWPLVWAGFGSQREVSPLQLDAASLGLHIEETRQSMLEKVQSISPLHVLLNIKDAYIPSPSPVLKLIYVVRMSCDCLLQS